jgi:hypothetical protein
MGELFEKLFARLGVRAFSEYGVMGILCLIVAYFVLLLIAKLIRYVEEKKDEFGGWFQMLCSVWGSSSQAKNEAIHSGICAAVLLIAAFTSWPYFVYVLLRVFICGSSAYIASRLHSQHRVLLTWICGAIALLYNPILPVKMARSDWEVINVLTAILYIGFSVHLNWSSLLRRQPATTVADSVEEDVKRESWIEVTAAEYLEDELSKQAFFTFTRESPAMKLAFHNCWGRTLSPQRPLTRGRLTIIFNEVGIQLASSGDSEGSYRSFACSSLFIKRNPLTWAALAEVAFAKEDRMAATWAEKVIKFRLLKSTSPELREYLTTDEAKVLLGDARKRMRQIIAACQVCTSWHDSTEVFNQMGIANSYFDR